MPVLKFKCSWVSPRQLRIAFSLLSPRRIAALTSGGSGQWTAIDWDQRRRLSRKPLAQALHGYYSSHRNPYPVSVQFLQKITGSRNRQPAGFKRRCREALDDLVEVGFLSSYSIEKAKTSPAAGGFVLAFRPGAATGVSPVLSAGLEPSQSWLSANKYMIGVLLVIGGVVAAVFLLR